MEVSEQARVPAPLPEGKKRWLFETSGWLLQPLYALLHRLKFWIVQTVAYLSCRLRGPVAYNVDYTVLLLIM